MSFPLLTLDEGRAAFVASAAEVLRATLDHTPTVVGRFLSGGGSTSRLSEPALGVVLAHRALLEHLTTLGYAWAISDEIDGVVSIVVSDEAGPVEALEVLLSLVDAPRHQGLVA